MDRLYAYHREAETHRPSWRARLDSVLDLELSDGARRNGVRTGNALKTL